MCSVSTEGAPPLRFLQGRAEMMPVLQDLLRSDGIDPDARAFPCPALHKEREGRGTHSVGDASKVKNLGHPPPSLVVRQISSMLILNAGPSQPSLGQRRSKIGKEQTAGFEPFVRRRTD